MIKMLEGEGYNPTHQHPYHKSIFIRDQQNFLIKMEKMARKSSFTIAPESLAFNALHISCCGFDTLTRIAK